MLADSVKNFSSTTFKVQNMKSWFAQEPKSNWFFIPNINVSMMSSVGISYYQGGEINEH